MENLGSTPCQYTLLCLLTKSAGNQTWTVSIAGRYSHQNNLNLPRKTEPVSVTAEIECLLLHAGSPGSHPEEEIKFVCVYQKCCTTLFFATTCHRCVKLRMGLHKCEHVVEKQIIICSLPSSAVLGVCKKIL